MHLERADPHRHHRTRGLRVMDPELLGALEQVVEPGDDPGLDRGDVERELEGIAQADGSALELVGLGRHEAVAEVRRDVHEHRRSGQGLVIDADQVVDRLDRRTRLAPAVGQDVELGLELPVALRRVARAADVGEDLARAVVDDARGGVVDVVAAQAQDPAVVLPGDPLGPQDRARIPCVRGAGRGVDVLLGDLLQAHVDRRRHVVAADVHLVAGIGGVRAQDLGEVLADLPHEMRRLPVGGDERRQDDGLLLGGLVLGGGVLGAGQRGAGLHEVEDEVAPLHDLRARRHDELDVVAAVAAGLGLARAELVGVLHEVELRRRLRDRGQDRELGQRELRERLAEVALRGRLHAVAAVPVEVLVQVGRDDRFLALLTGEGAREADRLDDLAELALVHRPLERGGRQEAGSDELLGDRRGATRAARDRVETGGDEGDRVEAGVLPEVLVLDRGGRVDHLAGDLVVGHDLTLEFAEAGELDLAGPVVEDRLLLVREVREGGLRIRQALRVVVVRAHGEDEARAGGQQGDEEEDEQDDEGDPTDDRAATRLLGAALERSSLAPAPREAGLHEWPHDSIGSVNQRSSSPRRVQTRRPCPL